PARGAEDAAQRGGGPCRGACPTAPRGRRPSAPARAAHGGAGTHRSPARARAPSRGRARAPAARAHGDAQARPAQDPRARRPRRRRVPARRRAGSERRAVAVTTAAGSPALLVDDLVVRFGELEAVGGVSFAVARGEVFGLLGPNGAGKTTTIRVLTTLLPPTAGRALVAGHDVRGESLQVRASIGYIPQAI